MLAPSNKLPLIPFVFNFSGRAVEASVWISQREVRNPARRSSTDLQRPNGSSKGTMKLFVIGLCS